MRQNLRTGEVDLITPGELGSALHEHLGSAFSRHLREIYRGLKIIKLPVIKMTATQTAFTLFSGPPGAQCGPESGYLWEVRRVLIASSAGATDTAVVTGLYSGSDSSANQNQLLDLAGVTLNKSYYPGSDGAWLWPDEMLYATLTGATVGNQYTLTGIAIEVPVEMQGKLLT